MALDDALRVTEFVEKSPTPPTMPGRPGIALASMGIYILDAAYLYDQLARDSAKTGSSHDFGRDLLPDIVARGEAIAHPFALSCVSRGGDAESYWRDVGTLDAYWAANIDLVAVTPEDRKSTRLNSSH